MKVISRSAPSAKAAFNLPKSNAIRIGEYEEYEPLDNTD
jgi:hypothetical protein